MIHKQLVYVRFTVPALEKILCVEHDGPKIAIHPICLHRFMADTPNTSDMEVAFKKALAAAIFEVGIVPASVYRL
jgi:hypothetical protein